MHSNKTENKSNSPILRYWSWHMCESSSSVTFEIFVFYIPWYVFCHLHVISDWFSNISHCIFCSLSYPKLVKVGIFKGWFLTITLPEKHAYGLMHKWSYLKKYEEYQIKAESVLLTMISKAHFTQKCHLFSVLWECITYMLSGIFVYKSRKFKGGICCGGHLAVTYGGELLYLWIFS